MKKGFFLIAASFLISYNSFSQGLEFGVKGIYNSTWLLNKHIAETSGSQQEYVPSFGYSYGVSGAIYFSDKFGIEMDILYANHSQQYTGTISTIDYNAETKLQMLDVPILLKFQSVAGVYVEAGILYSILSSAEYYNDIAPLISPYQEDISDKFNKHSFGGVIGAGINLDLFLGMGLTAGVRISGSFSDLEGIDALGLDLSDPINLGAVYGGEYEPTHSLSAGFLLGLNITIGN